MQWPQAYVVNINQMPLFPLLKSNEGAEHGNNKEDELGAAKVSIICKTMSTSVAATNQEAPSYFWPSFSFVKLKVLCSQGEGSEGKNPYYRAAIEDSKEAT